MVRLQQRNHQKRRNKCCLASVKGFLTVIAMVSLFFPFFLFWNLNYNPNLRVSTMQVQQHDDVSDPLSVFQSSSTGGIPQHLIGCVEHDCVNQVARKLARIYQPRTDFKWCLKDETASSQVRNDKNIIESWQGILMVKVPKGASSTSAGVAIRLSRRLGCHAVQFVHRTASHYQHHLKENSLLLTSIRDPAQRAVSTTFFHIISRQKRRVNVTDDLLIRLLTTKDDTHYGAVSKGQGGFQLRYTSLSSIPEHSAMNATAPTNSDDGIVIVKDPMQVIHRVHSTLHDYHFMLVTERMDESLVCLALLLGIDVADVLVTASKVAGGGNSKGHNTARFHFTRISGNRTVCFPTVKPTISPGVKTFLESPTWRAMNYGDYLLHAAAEQSLDLTIAQAFRPGQFQAALQRYRTLKQLVELQCQDEIVFPCSSQGVAQPALSKESCYLPYFDFGCGYKCVDRIIAEHDNTSH